MGPFSTPISSPKWVRFARLSPPGIIFARRYAGAAEDIIHRALADIRESSDHQNASDRAFGVADGGSDVAAARSILNQFATRAFRRPVADDEVDPLVEHYLSRVADGVGHEAAILEVLQVVLVSPSCCVDEWHEAIFQSHFGSESEFADQFDKNGTVVAAHDVVRLVQLHTHTESTAVDDDRLRGTPGLGQISDIGPVLVE